MHYSIEILKQCVLVLRGHDQFGYAQKTAVALDVMRPGLVDGSHSNVGDAAADRQSRGTLRQILMKTHA